MTRADGITVVSTWYPRGDRIAPHAHQADLCYLVAAGSVRERRPGRARLCGSGEAVFHPLGLRHWEEFPQANTSCVIVEWAPAWIAAMDPQPERSIDPGVYRGGTVPWIVARIAREAESPDRDASLVIECLAIALRCQCRIPTRRRRKRPPWLDLTMEYLEAGGGSLGQVAREVGVHPGHLAREFMRHCGCTLGEYARRRRTERAVALLRSSRLPLAAVAARTGFADQSHLGRAVRRYLAATPLAVRNGRAYSRVSF